MIDLFSGILAQPQVVTAPRQIVAALESFLEDVIKFHDECSVGAANPDTVMYSAADLKQVFVFGHVSRSAAFCVGYAAPPPPHSLPHTALIAGVRDAGWAAARVQIKNGSPEDVGPLLAIQEREQPREADRWATRHHAGGSGDRLSENAGK